MRALDALVAGDAERAAGSESGAAPPAGGFSAGALVAAAAGAAFAAACLASVATALVFRRRADAPRGLPVLAHAAEPGHGRRHHKHGRRRCPSDENRRRATSDVEGDVLSELARFDAEPALPPLPEHDRVDVCPTCQV
jgi:hypothetical protein